MARLLAHTPNPFTLAPRHCNDMPSTAPSSLPKSQKPKKMSTGRGGGGNFRTVKEKSYVTETSKNASTTKRILEVEPPRFKAAYSGRGGAGNKWDHVLEDGVFGRVMQYELSKVQANKAERDTNRQPTTRPRTYSNAKSTRASTLGSDDASANQNFRSTHVSWASKSNVDVTSHMPHEHKRNLRDTLLAPLKTSFMRRPRSVSSVSAHEDNSSFSAGSSSDSRRVPSTIAPSIAPSDLIASPMSDDPYSPTAPSTIDMLGDFAGSPITRRRSTGGHKSPRSPSIRLAPPLPSPTTPLPPTPNNVMDRSSLPVPLPTRPDTNVARAQPIHSPPPPPSVPTLRIPVKSLRATAAPVYGISQFAPSYSSSASSSKDKLTVPDPTPRTRTTGGPHLRAPNRRLYNASVAARSTGALPLPLAAREASFYDGSDVDRVDPFLPNLAESEEVFYDSLLPWLNPPTSTLSSVSSISIPSFNDSSPEMVTTA